MRGREREKDRERGEKRGKRGRRGEKREGEGKRGRGERKGREEKGKGRGREKEMHRVKYITQNSLKGPTLTRLSYTCSTLHWHTHKHRLTLWPLISIDMNEREARLIAHTQLLVEHLKAESVRMYGHLFLLLISALGIVDLKDYNLHLHGNTQVDVATQFSICEERCT